MTGGVDFRWEYFVVNTIKDFMTLGQKGHDGGRLKPLLKEFA